MQNWDNYSKMTSTNRPRVVIDMPLNTVIGNAVLFFHPLRVQAFILRFIATWNDFSRQIIIDCMTTGTISLHYVITMREKRNHLYATTWRACTDTSTSFNFLTCVVRTLYKKHKAIMKFVISFMAYRSFFQGVPQTVKKITHYVVALHMSPTLG